MMESMEIPELLRIHVAEDVPGETEVDTMTMLETVLAVSNLESRIQNNEYYLNNSGDQLKIYKYMSTLYKLHDKLHFVIASMEAMSQMKVR